jgi:hypothetical protein
MIQIFLFGEKEESICIIVKNLMWCLKKYMTLDNKWISQFLTSIENLQSNGQAKTTKLMMCGQ